MCISALRIPAHSGAIRPGTSFNPGTLAPNTTYYWRIDEVDQYGTTAGNVWNFTTMQTKASNPRPASSAVNVPVNPTLSWTAGNGAISHNVYFGTSNPPAFYVNQTATDFVPNVLNFNTTYYWRVDEVGSSGTVTGDLWTITTASGIGRKAGPGQRCNKSRQGYCFALDCRLWRNFTRCIFGYRCIRRRSGPALGYRRFGPERTG